MKKEYKQLTFEKFCEFPQDIQEKLWNNAQDYIAILREQVDLLKKIELLTRVELADFKADIEEIYNEKNSP